MQKAKKLTIILFVSLLTFMPIQSYATDFSLIDAGTHHSISVTDSIWTYGWNDFGQLGNDSTANFVYPQPVYPLADQDILEVEVGKQHSLALTLSGNVYAWGYHQSGQLGIGVLDDFFQVIPRDDTWTTEEKTEQQQQNSGIFDTPQRVVTADGTALNDINWIASGDNHTLAKTKYGDVYAWGDNSFGQLGIGNSGNKFVATKIEELSNIHSIDAHGNQSLAIDHTGTAWAWGENTSSLHSNSLQITKSPKRVEKITNVDSASLGNSHVLFTKSDGVYSVGYESYLSSDSTIVNYEQVRKVFGLPEGTHTVSAGANHNLALDSDGRVWSWGANPYGELGIGDTVEQIKENVTVPQIVEGLPYIWEISAGNHYSLATNQNGDVWAWGLNDYGQLGLGHSVNQRSPQKLTLKSVSGVSLNKSQITLNPEETYQLIANVVPHDALNKEVVWTSSNEDVVSVTQDGLITAHNPTEVNQATITAKTKDGGYTASVVVTVKIAVTNIELEHNQITLDDKYLEKETYKIRAIIYPYNATDQRIIWNSADPKIATVDNQGNVTAVSPGTTTVSATTLDGGWKDSLTINVRIPIYSVQIDQGDDPIYLSQEDTLSVSTSIYPSYATNQALFGWSSSNRYVAEVDYKGNVTAKNPGEAIITVTSQDGRITDSIKLIVSDDPRIEEINLSSSLFIEPGDQKIVSVSTEPEVRNTSSLVWKVRDEQIATVDHNGKITAHATGETTLTVRTSDWRVREEMRIVVGLKDDLYNVWKKKTTTDENKSWRISFNTAIALSSINSNTVAIMTEDNYPVPVELDLLADGKTIRVTPKSPYAKAYQYRLIIKDLTSTHGVKLKNYVELPFIIK